jgi:hypothetical protein
MGNVKVPEQLRVLFDEPALGHVSHLNDKGQIVTFPMWVDYDGEHILTSSPVGSRKGQAFRKRLQIAISIVSTTNPWVWVSISGRVIDINPDENLEFIDRMARKYTGREYQRRTPREIFTVEIDRARPSDRQLARFGRD